MYALILSIIEFSALYLCQWLKMTGKAYCAGFVTGTRAELSMDLIENIKSAGCPLKMFL